MSLSDYILLIGGIAFFLSSIRSGRMRILRDTNVDLTTRNQQLEAEKVELNAKIVVLEGQPNLEKHQEVLEAMLDSLKDHDSRMQAAARETQAIFHEMLGELREIRTTVVPPPHLAD